MWVPKRLAFHALRSVLSLSFVQYGGNFHGSEADFVRLSIGYITFPLYMQADRAIMAETAGVCSLASVANGLAGSKLA